MEVVFARKSYVTKQITHSSSSSVNLQNKTIIMPRGKEIKSRFMVCLWLIPDSWETFTKQQFQSSPTPYPSRLIDLPTDSLIDSLFQFYRVVDSSKKNRIENFFLLSLFCFFFKPNGHKNIDFDITDLLLSLGNYRPFYLTKTNPNQTKAQQCFLLNQL